MADIRQHFKVLNSAVQARVLMSFLSVRAEPLKQKKVPFSPRRPLRPAPCVLPHTDRWLYGAVS